MRTLLPLLLLPALGGCFMSKTEQHAPLNPTSLASIEPGTTTAQQVMELLGAPTEVVQLGRRSAYRYDHTIEKQAALFLIIFGLRGVDTQQDRAWIFFDEQGVVTHAGSTLEAGTAEYELPTDF